jgi:UPF0271 protein
MLTVDLNCDVGEGFGCYRSGNDEALMQCISSANIACGFHAGDPAVMQETVALAIKYNVTIGAHPGLHDLEGFGRRNIAIDAREAYQLTLYQVGALAAFAVAAGTRLHHVKPHGALYNMAAENLPLAQAIAAAVHDYDKGIVLYGLAGSTLIAAGQKRGLKVAEEVFADRSYTSSGMLTPRGEAGALIQDSDKAVQQVLHMVKHNKVKSTNGVDVNIKPDTICLHGDGEGAVDFAKAVRDALISAGAIIQPI